MDRSPIHVEVHPPERGRRRGVVLCNGCCCCCCLFTVGGLVGALIGSALPVRHNRFPAVTPPPPGALDEFRLGEAPAGSADEHITERRSDVDASLPSEQITETPPERRAVPISPPPHIPAMSGNPGPSGAVLYWLVGSFLALAVFFYFHIGDDPGPGRKSEAGVFALLMLMPVIQMGSSLLSHLVLFFWPAPEREVPYERICWITLSWFVGTMLGAVLTVFYCWMRW